MNVTDIIPQTEENAKVWRMSQQGGTFRVQSPLPEQPQSLRKSKRGKVSGYSRGSAQRLRFVLNSVNHSAYAGGLHLTVTYDEFHLPETAEACKRDLDRFLKWLSRHFSGVPVVWRMEFGEKNGRVHFHLLILCRSWANPDTIRDAWGNGFIKVRFYESAKLWRYISKYVGKAEETEEEESTGDGTGADGGAPEGDPCAVDLTPAHISPQREKRWRFTGRIWGIRSRKTVLWAHLESYPIAKNDIFETFAVFRTRRVMRNWKKSDRWYRVKAFQERVNGVLDGTITPKKGEKYPESWHSLPFEDVQRWSRRVNSRINDVASRLKKQPLDIVAKHVYYSLRPAKAPSWLAVKDYTRWSVLVPQHLDCLAIKESIYWETVCEFVEKCGTIEQAQEEAHLSHEMNMCAR